MADIRLVPLQREYPESEALLPRAMARIGSFCARYDTDSKASYMMSIVLHNYQAAEPMMRTVLILRGDDLVGHCVVSIDEWCGVRYATIVAFETDLAVPRDLLRDGFEQIEAWAKGRGATILRVLARTDERGPARARTFRMLYGVRPRSLIMDKALT